MLPPPSAQALAEAGSLAGALEVTLPVKDEPFAGVRVVGFALVWLALAVFSYDLVSQRRRVVLDPIG